MTTHPTDTLKPQIEELIVATGDLIDKATCGWERRYWEMCQGRLSAAKCYVHPRKIKQCLETASFWAKEAVEETNLDRLLAVPYKQDPRYLAEVAARSNAKQGAEA